MHALENVYEVHKGILIIISKTSEIEKAYFFKCQDRNSSLEKYKWNILIKYD